MIIDTLRPNGTTAAGGWAATGAASLQAATSDDSDATYALGQTTDTLMLLTAPAHSPAANHERHRFRSRIRGRQDDAAGAGLMALNAGIYGYQSTLFAFDEVITTFSAPYISLPVLGSVNPLSLLFTVEPWSGNTDEARVMELYIDIDTRARPTFTPDVLDGAGVSRDGGVISDTPRADLRYGTVNYDGLNARDWAINVQTVPGGVNVYSAQGVGTPPVSVVTDPLPNGDYVATFITQATIRTIDAITALPLQVTFEIDFISPAAPVLTSTPAADPPSVELDWVSGTPTSTPWDTDADVVTEIERTDCNGISTIYMERTGTGPSLFLDRFMALTQPNFYCIDRFGSPGGTVLRLAGTGYASAPDVPAFGIVGDIDIRALVDPDSWTPAATNTIASQWPGGTNTAWSFELRSDASLLFRYSPDGTATVADVSTTNLVGTVGAKWLRVTHDVNNGGGSRTTTFYTSDDGATWTVVGVPVVAGTAGALFNSTAAVRVGARQASGLFFEGDIYEVELYAGINGTLVADPDFTESPWASASTAEVDSFGNVWTLNGDAEIISVCDACYRARYWGLVDDVVVASDWSNTECEIITNPTPGNAWLRGAVDGNLSACPDESYSFSRPFGAFQPIGGGIPTVVTGSPGGRDYALTIPVTSEADQVTLDAILAQPLLFYQPVAQADIWLAPRTQSVQVVKVGRIRVTSVDLVAVNPQPVADPTSFF